MNTIGHISRHGSLLKTIIKGYVERGRPGAEYTTQIMTDMNYKDLKELRSMENLQQTNTRINNKREMIDEK